MKIWALVVFVFIYKWWVKTSAPSSPVSKWLSEQKLSDYENVISEHGIHNMLDLAAIQTLPQKMPAVKGARLLAASQHLFNQLVLQHWLVQVHQQQHSEKLSTMGVESLDDLLHHQDRVMNTSPALMRHIAKLPADAQLLSALKQQLFDELRAAAKPPDTSWGPIWCAVALVCVAVVADFLYRSWRDLASAGQAALSLATPFRRLLQLTIRCTVQLHWQNKRRVGGTVSLTVQACRLDGQPHVLLCRPTGLEVRVHTASGTQVACALECRADGSAACTFPVRTAGVYSIKVMLDGRHVDQSPYIRTFLADLPAAQCSTLITSSSTLVMTQGQPHALVLDLADSYRNPCEPEDWPEVRPRIAITVTELDSARSVTPYEQLELVGHRIRLKLVLSRKGCFRAAVTYDGECVGNGELHLIVLSAYQMAAVRKHIESWSVSFSAQLAAVDGKPLNKPRDVWCAVSSRQLKVGETFLYFLWRTLYTFRLCPSTRLTPTNENNTTGLPSLLVSDGGQQSVELTLKDRDMLAATFVQFMLRNIGGSETFADKQRHLYWQLERSWLAAGLTPDPRSELLLDSLFHVLFIGFIWLTASGQCARIVTFVCVLLAHMHRLCTAGRARRRMTLRVRREALLQSSMAALRGASAADWARPFEIKFDDEEALDYGGVRREWFELICQELFDPRTKLFVPLDPSDAQALVHPNWRRPTWLKLRHYEFAGLVIAKGLLESSQGAAARQLVKACFTRSFLAQLIGLKVSYKHFEQDDRELYRNKIALIETCSAEDLAAFELTFTDEEFDEHGRLIRTVDLLPGGSRTAVTPDTRLEYLQMLAQHRLATRCRAETEAFLKGLNKLVPDQLLSIFDENELELLMCGSSDFSTADLRLHHTVTDHGAGFQKVVEWFWTALENFTGEEMSKLLQFTTGSSRLPAGGFAELAPNFQISSHHEFGALPVAHTCFNQICLPDHNNYGEFERALLLALREGNVGFGLL